MDDDMILDEKTINCKSDITNKTKLNNQSNIKQTLILKNGKWYFSNNFNFNYNQRQKDIYDKTYIKILKEEEKDVELLNPEALKCITYQNLFFSNVWFIPTSKIKIIWDSLMFALIIIISLFYSFELAYNPNITFISYFLMVIEGFLIVDIVFSFNTAFYEGTYLIVNKKRIAIRYMYFWFWIDIISSIPSYMILFLATEYEALNYFGHSLIVKKIHFLKVLLFARAYKITDNYNLGGNFTNKIIISMYKMNTIILLLFIKYFLLIILMAHFGTCFMYYISNEKNSNMDILTYYELEDETIFNKYITFMYFFIQTISTVGYGSYTPHILSEKVLIILYLGLFGGLFSSLIGSITIIFEYKYNMKSSERKTISNLNKLAGNLPYSTREKVRLELKNKLKIQESKLISLQDLNQMLNNDFFKQTDIYLNLKIINHIPILNKIPLISIYLAGKLTFKDYLSGEYLFEEDTLCSKFICLIKGKIEISSNKRKAFKYSNSKAYTIYGNLEFALDRKTWIYTAKAESFVEVAICKFNALNKVGKEIQSKNETIFDEFSYIIKKTRTKLNTNNDFSIINESCHFCSKYDHFSINCLEC